MSALTCREFVQFLDDYEAGALSAGRRATFEEHLRICPECVDYLGTYREAIRLTRATLSAGDPDGRPPSDAPEELIQAILECL